MIRVSTRAEQYLWIALALACLLAYFGPLGAHLDGWQGAVLYGAFEASRYAARLGERRKAAAEVHHHHADALRACAKGMEDAAVSTGANGIHTTLTYEQAARMLRNIANQRDQDQP